VTRAGGRGNPLILPRHLPHELDPVAVRIFDEGKDGGPVLHRTRLAHDLAAEPAHPLAGSLDVVGADRDVAEAGAELGA
jgi:hypothetical protein